MSDMLRLTTTILAEDFSEDFLENFLRICMTKYT